MPNKKLIILCLDIDQTIMSHASPNNLIDINGSNEFGDGSAWIECLNEIKAYCEQSSFQFIVQIITAKDGIDSLVVQVFSFLYPFLQLLDKHANPIFKFIDPIRGYVATDEQLHFMDHKDKIKKYLNTDNYSVNINTNNELLPPIHLCRNNIINNESFQGAYLQNGCSKALVMKYISEHFKYIPPPENVFLLDDQIANIKDVMKYRYQGISAKNLYDLEAGTKAQRTEACKLILRITVLKIRDRVDYLNYGLIEYAVNSIYFQPYRYYNYSTLFIHNAVINRNFHGVRQIIALDKNTVHFVDTFNQTPLLLAAFLGYNEIVDFLLENGSDVNQPTILPDNGCYQEHHLKTPLDWAITGCHYQTALNLLKKGATTNFTYTKIKNKNVRELIITDDLLPLKVLLKCNKSLINSYDNRGFTPLHYAAKHRREEIIHFLIHSKADINATTISPVGSFNKSRRNMTAMELWHHYHHTLGNPFNRYYRVDYLERRKSQLTTIIKSKISIFAWTSTSLMNEKNALTNLKRKIRQAEFTSTDDYFKTADELLMDLTNAWANDLNLVNSINNSSTTNTNRSGSR